MLLHQKVEWQYKYQQVRVLLGLITVGAAAAATSVGPPPDSGNPLFDLLSKRGRKDGWGFH